MYLSTKVHFKNRSAKDLFDIAYAMFSDFLYKSMCCGYSLNFDVIQMRTHNVCLYKVLWVPITYGFIKVKTKSTLAVI